MDSGLPAPGGPRPTYQTRYRSGSPPARGSRTLRLSRPSSDLLLLVAWSPDETYTQYQDTEGQGDGAHERKVDHGVRLRGLWREHGQEERHRQQDRCCRDRVPDHALEPPGKVGLVYVAQCDQREDEQHAGVRVPSPPEVLAQLVLRVVGVAYQEREDAGPAVDDGRQQDQEHARREPRLTAHGLAPPSPAPHSA